MADDYDGRVIFDQLQLWIDPVNRSGPEAMATDEWLLATAKTPMLRVYGWLGEWCSVGYFGKLADAKTSFPGIACVRRWTGGGMVDHRADWTYTLVVPRREKLTELRGAESYRMIHARLAETLDSEGIEVSLSIGNDETGASLCFENPVSHDLVSQAGRKLAGAGQRRTSRGLLHQGSVAAACELEQSKARAQRLAACISAEWHEVEYDPPAETLAEKVLERYGRTSWTQRR